MMNGKYDVGKNRKIELMPSGKALFLYKNQIKIKEEKT